MTGPVFSSREGARIVLTVRPQASRSRIDGIHGDRLKVSVTAAPEKGRANRAVEKLLARTLGLARASVEVVAGETSREKLLAVSGLSVEQVRDRLRI